MVVPTLVELFRSEEPPQEEPLYDVSLLAASLPLLLLLEESGLGLLAEATLRLVIPSPVATPTSAAASLVFSLAHPIVHPSEAGL